MQMHTYASRDQHRCERHNFVTRREKSLAADNQRWRASVRFEARAGSRETRPTGVRARCRSSYRYETSCERTPSTCQGNWIRKIRFETPFARRSREDREKIGCTQSSELESKAIGWNTSELCIFWSLHVDRILITC